MPKQTEHPLARWHTAGVVKLIRLDIERRGLLDVIGHRRSAKERKVDVAAARREIDRIGRAGDDALRRQRFGNPADCVAVEKVNPGVGVIVNRNQKPNVFERAIAFVSQSKFYPAR